MRRRRGPKFIFSSIGTQGDLLPMLWLAAELVKRGHRCHMLGSLPGVQAAAALGVEYSPIAPAQANNVVSTEESFGGYIFPSYEPTFRVFEQEVARERDVVVVNRSQYSASTLMCERYGLPLSRVYLAPAHLRSCDAPPWPWKPRASGMLKQAFKKYQLPKIYEGQDANPFILGRLNLHRERLGLRPIDSSSEHERLVSHHLGLFPEWYASRASDWPELDFCGFPLPSASDALPGTISQLLDAHGRPLVFTPGTGVVDVYHFFAAARRCCEILDRPGIFLSPHYSAAALEPGGKILHFDFLALELLLPHAALLAHHGGIGTTARALEASVPQIVCPRAYDQPDNGSRVADLGVGAVLGPERWSGETLAEAANSLIGSEHTRVRLEELSRAIASQDGLAGAAAALEQRFARADTELEVRVRSATALV